MKTILSLILSLAFLQTHAQSTTNIITRWTLEVVTGGITNSQQLNLRWDYGTKREALLIDGLNFAYSNYLVAGGTNTFHQWLRANYATHVKNYADQKQDADNRETLRKLTILLTAESDLLSNADLNNLATIAAKAP